MADFRSAYFGLTGQYPTDVQEDEAEQYAQRLASSPYQRLSALAGWLSGANIAAGAPGPRFGSLRVYRGSGGPQSGGGSGSFFTSRLQRAASHGPKVDYVELPDEVAAKAQAAARQAHC